MDAYIMLLIVIFIPIPVFHSLKHPTFISEWKEIEAENPDKHQIIFSHKLKSLPSKVDVQVRPQGGNNYGFTFPGTSSAQRDDDLSYPWGGVIYVYNESHVIVFTTFATQNSAYGYVINTGLSETRAGSNFQQSKIGEVRVRVWSACDFPKPDFMSEWIDIQDNSGTSSFVEIDTNLGEYPNYLAVQVRLMEGLLAGYYIDGTGTAMVNSQYIYHQYGGVLFGYDMTKVRIWLPTPSTKQGMVFRLDDGWASGSYFSSRGQARVSAWLSSFGTAAMLKVAPIGKVTPDEEYSITRNDEESEIFVNVEVMAASGNNAGFRFQGVGTAQEKPGTLGTYGGVVYGYSNNTVRFWKPSSNSYGYVVHVGNKWGAGINSDQIDTATIVISVWEFNTEENNCGSEACVLSTESFHCKCCAPNTSMCTGSYIFDHHDIKSKIAGAELISVFCC